MSAVSEILKHQVQKQPKLPLDSSYPTNLVLDCYVMLMKCLSVFGVLMLALSIYVIVLVPAKLSFSTRLGVLGHAIVSGLCQISLTIGTIPVFILPCPSGYPNGVLTYLGMKTKDQTVLQVLLIISMGWFPSYLAMVRAFAVRGHHRKQLEDRLLISYVVFLAFHFFFVLYMGTKIKDYGEEGRALCIKEFTTAPPPEIYLDKAVFFVLEKDIFIVSMMIDIIFVTITFGAVTLTCGITLFISLKIQARTSMSSKFLKFQKNSSLVIFFLTMSQIFGIVVPGIGCIISVMAKVPLPIVASINFLTLGLYPVIGCGLILIVTPAYKSKLQAMSCSLINLFRTSGRMNVVYNIPINLNNVEC